MLKLKLEQLIPILTLILTKKREIVILSKFANHDFEDLILFKNLNT